MPFTFSPETDEEQKLNSEQTRVVSMCIKYLHQWLLFTKTAAKKPEPFHTLIHGDSWGGGNHFLHNALYQEQEN